MHRVRSRTAAVCAGLLAVVPLVAAPGPALAASGPAAAPDPSGSTTPGPDGTTPATTPPATGTPVPRSTASGTGPDLSRFYGQRLDWAPCEGAVPAAMRCADLTVPLDYADPAKGTTTVAVARMPATGPGGAGGSVVLNFGGPGGPGVEILGALSKRFADLNKTRDLVTFDPRGVGRSTPVTCGGSLEPAPARDAAGQLAALREVARRCARASGPVLPYVGTVHVARDLDVLRQALGRRTLDYLGFSYGTRLGAVYAAQFPRRTGRMVLDGVDTLTESLTEQALVSAQGQQRAFDNFLTWCAHQRGCVYGTNTRTAKERAAELVTRLDTEPLTGFDGTPFTGQDVVSAVSQALYSREAWPALARGLALAEQDGDPSGLLELGGPVGPPEDEDPGADDSGEPVLVPADNEAAALTAVNCADDPDRSAEGKDPEAVEREIEDLVAEFTAASRIFGPRQLMTVLACYGRPAGTGFIRSIDHPGAPRMLLVGTRGDPATPYRWTEETAARLGSAVVLDYKGDGHGAYLASPCVRGYVDAFLVDGRLPHGTRSCPAGE
ncbi:alpha/beta hydrolase [Streptomyces sp. NPDC097619]|uniref:alpha/beta hydrolase n=1 Tax=Streptomyces sp. NPDC097619 TaxID=3157228 RepID=UPI003322929F